MKMHGNFRSVAVSFLHNQPVQFSRKWMFQYFPHSLYSTWRKHCKLCGLRRLLLLYFRAAYCSQHNNQPVVLHDIVVALSRGDFSVLSTPYYVCGLRRLLLLDIIVALSRGDLSVLSTPYYVCGLRCLLLLYFRAAYCRHHNNQPVVLHDIIVALSRGDFSVLSWPNYHRRSRLCMPLYIMHDMQWPVEPRLSMIVSS